MRHYAQAILIDGLHRFPDEPREGLVTIDAESMLAGDPNLMGALLAWHERGMAQLRVLAAQIRSFMGDPAEVAYTADAMRQIEVPTLIVLGDRDEFYPISVALELYESLPNAELWIMPNVGHGAFLTYQFEPEGQRSAACILAGEQFPAAVVQFLSRIR